MAADDDNFLSRWSRRKAAVRQGTAPAEAARSVAPDAALRHEAHAAPLTGGPPLAGEGALPSAAGEPPPAPPLPTLAEAELLTPASDFTRFVARGVDPGVKNAALRRLFLDPHFNVMDGLDTYIDDYGIPDPLPPGMLERMTQSETLGLFRKQPEPPHAAPDEPTAGDAPRQAGPGLAIATDAADAADPAARDTEALAATPQPLDSAPDEDTDLRLQPHHDAGCASPQAGPGQDAGRPG